MSRDWTRLLLVTGLLAFPVALRAQQRYPPTIDNAGNYHWTYTDSQGAPREFIFTPSTKIAPGIKADFSATSPGNVLYTYTIANGPAAAQKL